MASYMDGGHRFIDDLAQNVIVDEDKLYIAVSNQNDD